MGALTFDALLRSLKQGAPDPVYYLHGEEDVLKDEAVRVLLERAVDPAARDFNVDQRTAADLDPEAFNALVNTPPILAATRAVVLRGMEQDRKSTRLNSSHSQISYAVFCLKKKKIKHHLPVRTDRRGGSAVHAVR